jgi:hypothetical protein
VLADDKEIIRGRMGIMLPNKNAFEFTDKVVPDFGAGKGKEGKKEENGRQKLSKTLLNLKKQNSR